MANKAPAVFHLPQFKGSALELDGIGSLSVLPSFVMRKVLPARLYDSRFEGSDVPGVDDLERYPIIEGTDGLFPDASPVRGAYIGCGSETGGELSGGASSTIGCGSSNEEGVPLEYVSDIMISMIREVKERLATRVTTQVDRERTGGLTNEKRLKD